MNTSTSSASNGSNRPSARRIGRVAAVGLVAGVIGLTAACGSSGDGTVAASPEGPAAASSAAGQAATGQAATGQAATGQGQPDSGTSAPESSTVITIDDYSYGDPLTVAPGRRVTVHNDDMVAHTVTEDEGDAFDAVVGANDSTTFTAPTSPGTYDYHCSYHANMHGTVIVEAQ